jgi:hypothetical protein
MKLRQAWSWHPKRYYLARKRIERCFEAEKIVARVVKIDPIRAHFQDLRASR